MHPHLTQYSAPVSIPEPQLGQKLSPFPFFVPHFKHISAFSEANSSPQFLQNIVSIPFSVLFMSYDNMPAPIRALPPTTTIIAGINEIILQTTPAIAIPFPPRPVLILMIPRIRLITARRKGITGMQQLNTRAQIPVTIEATAIPIGFFPLRSPPNAIYYTANINNIRLI